MALSSSADILSSICQILCTSACTSRCGCFNPLCTAASTLAVSVGHIRVTTACAMPAGDVGSIAFTPGNVGDCSVSAGHCGAAILASPVTVSLAGGAVEDTAQVYDRSTKWSM